MPNIVTIYSWDEEASDTGTTGRSTAATAAMLSAWTAFAASSTTSASATVPIAVRTSTSCAQLAADAEFIKQLQQSNQQLAGAVVRVDPNYLELQRKHKKLSANSRRLQGWR